LACRRLLYEQRQFSLHIQALASGKLSFLPSFPTLVMTRGEGTSMGPLHVVNPRDSLELETMSSDAPPRYSSDHQASSSIDALQQGRHLKSHADNEDDSLSMHSCPDGGLHETLPSPYSTENLIQIIDTSQGHDYTVPAAPSSTYSRVCSHGHAYNYIHCCSAPIA